MSDIELRSTASVAGHPLHVMLVPFPIACFIGTLATDIAYWCTADMMWANFSAWLLAAGLLIGGLAALFGLIDLFENRDIRRLPQAWLHLIGNLLVLGLSLINAFVRSRDGCFGRADRDPLRRWLS